MFEAFVGILLILSLNQDRLTFSLYMRQTWMTQLILGHSIRGVVFLESERFLFLIYMVLRFM